MSYLPKLLKFTTKNIGGVYLVITENWVSNGLWLVRKELVNEREMLNLKESIKEIQNITDETINNITEQVQNGQDDEILWGVLYILYDKPYLKTKNGHYVYAYFLVYFEKLLSKSDTWRYKTIEDLKIKSCNDKIFFVYQSEPNAIDNQIVMFCCVVADDNFKEN
jgi:hypothetical protein